MSGINWHLIHTLSLWTFILSSLLALLRTVAYLVHASDKLEVAILFMRGLRVRWAGKWPTLIAAAALLWYLVGYR